MFKEKVRTPRWRLGRARIVIGLACVLLVAAPRAKGQKAGTAVYREQLRVLLEEQTPVAREVGVEAGGWFSFAFFNYDDESARTERTLRQYELRGWGSVNVQGVHRAYIRGLTSYSDWNSGTSPATHGDDLVEPKLERAWYELNLGQLARNQTGQQPPVDFRFKVGRAYTEIGTALVLSMPLDLVQFDLTVADWNAKVLLGKAIKSTANIDFSEPVAGHQDRCFWGIELAYEGFSSHRPFVYFLDNQDNTDPDPDFPDQSYSYDSRYVGLGSEGSLLTPNLRYSTELVGEWGRTYSEGVSAGRDDICAMAFDLLLEYFFDWSTHPRVAVEYLFATGDDDRRRTTSATIGGNLPGTTDRAFNAFGFRDTGLAFSPRLSNLHIYNLDASFLPFENIEPFKRMEIGSKVFFYHKADASGPISDTTADQPSRWVGWEWDIYCDWRVTSDLVWTTRYGVFRPGAAFKKSDSCRDFLYTGFLLSF